LTVSLFLLNFAINRARITTDAVRCLALTASCPLFFFSSFCEKRESCRFVYPFQNPFAPSFVCLRRARHDSHTRSLVNSARLHIQLCGKRTLCVLHFFFSNSVSRTRHLSLAAWSSSLFLPLQKNQPSHWRPAHVCERVMVCLTAPPLFISRPSPPTNLRRPGPLSLSVPHTHGSSIFTFPHEPPEKCSPLSVSWLQCPVSVPRLPQWRSWSPPRLTPIIRPPVSRKAVLFWFGAVLTARAPALHL
jgi:hypothetical protein